MANFQIMTKGRKDGQEDVVCVISGDHGGGVFIHVRGRFSAADKVRIQVHPRVPTIQVWPTIT